MLFLFVKIKSLPSAKRCSSSLFAHFVPRKLDRYLSRDLIWPLSPLKHQNSDSCAYIFYGWQLGIYHLSCVHFLHKRELRKFQVSVVQWWLRKEPNGLICYADFVFLLIKPIAFFGVLFVNSLSSSMPNAPYYWTKRIIRYAWNYMELKQRRFWATHVNRKWGIFSLKCFRATKFKSCVWLFTYRGRTGVWRCIESHVLWKQVNLKRSSGNLRVTDDDVRLFS